ncbi:hypothetical protein ACF3DV_04505 [Chlorogloeopsis fritschii PCC 9212]|uniref:Uncharacterized protein n=1 Tax=Chlorogloeopsis fritschii PCC 6912 TaxID=211165 RepID=A0A433NAA3_CHLFR|nr:hypothetical protein [Chlorogloeopsis fritschii]RUR78748.1 hypothetical protein PCC6912_35130 [Chlorogloeopsis fritschii PCC 6912]
MKLLMWKPISSDRPVNTDNTGRFTARLGNLKAGERVSAIAIHPQYGTSEPAYPALIRPIRNY